MKRTRKVKRSPDYLSERDFGKKERIAKALLRHLSERDLDQKRDKEGQPVPDLSNGDFGEK